MKLNKTFLLFVILPVSAIICYFLFSTYCSLNTTTASQAKSNAQKEAQAKINELRGKYRPTEFPNGCYTSSGVYIPVGTTISSEDGCGVQACGMSEGKPRFISPLIGCIYKNKAPLICTDTIFQITVNRLFGNTYYPPD